MRKNEPDLIVVAGTFLSIVIMISILTIVFTSGFPIFSQTGFHARFVESSENVGQRVSSLLWSYRYPDLIAHAFLVLASAACCVATLRPNSKEELE